MPRICRPYRPKVKGCYQCSQRRINCDRGEPMCAKCVSKGLNCSGLGIRHRFNDGMAARGKWVGKTVQAVHAKSTCTRDSSTALRCVINAEPGTLKYSDAPWIEHSRVARITPRNARFRILSSSPARDSGNDDGQRETSQREASRTPTEDQSLDASTANLAYNSGVETTSPVEPTNKPVQFTGGLKASGLSANNSRGPNSAILCQPVLGSMPLWKKMLLLNFSENIANHMVAIDGLHNGWRHLVLPIAHIDELVMDAVLAASALHLSTDDDATTNHTSAQITHRYASMHLQQHPSPDSLYARAIKSLLQRRDLAASSAIHQSFALLAILILLVAVMVSGSEDSTILLRMLHSAFEAIGGEDGLGEGALAKFMIRQIHKMRVYAAPFISEEDGFQALSSSQAHTQHVFECLNYCSQQRPDAAAAAPFIMSLVLQAHDIYLRQAAARVPPTDLLSQQPPPPLPSTSDSTQLVQRFKETLEGFPHDLPGEQVLVWATFIAASDCVLDEHKAFFEDVFLRYFVRSGFRNVLRGLDQLRRTWARRSARGEGERWTSVLPQAGVFVV